ncbi:response regulator transcription factor [Candidatus Roizmanbacteria bacterium]|nr:response regulator transcription factor [Candidatus Roizmanbacteria bacterium]
MQKTILIVEDDEELREYLKKILNDNNYSVITAGDGAEALKLVEKAAPDLVILDLGLPKVSGETVCFEIKQNYPEIVVIALTAKAKGSDVARGLRLGADDYISKPFAIEELIARIGTRLKTASEKETPNEKTAETKLSKIRLRESVVLLTLRLILTELLFGASFLFGALLISSIESYLNPGGLLPLYFILFIVLFLINVLTALFIFLKWNSEYVDVTNDGVIKHAGIIRKRARKYSCNFVEIITREQSFFGAIFNYGTLVLYDPALKEEVYITNIANPKNYSKEVEKILSKESGRPMPFVVKQ